MEGHPQSLRSGPGGAGSSGSDVVNIVVRSPEGGGGGVDKPPEGTPVIPTEHALDSALDRDISPQAILRTIFEPKHTEPGDVQGRTIAERGFPAGHIIKAVYDMEPTAEAMERLHPGKRIEDVALAVGQSNMAVVLVTVVKIKRKWRRGSR